jgi:RNA polymerase sigma factor (sigma-70 family)
VHPDLLSAVKAKESRAFKELYEAYVRYVYTIVNSYQQDPETCRDSIQEIFALVFLNIDSYDESKGAFKLWLRAICVNHCIKTYKREKRQIETQSLSSIAQPHIASEAELSREELLHLLKPMPSGYKEVFMLVVVDGYSHKEVGELLNISPETSRSQFSRAKQWLHQNSSRNTLNSLHHALQR